MIDPTVLYDKLAGFQTAEEIAYFLEEHEVKGTPRMAAHCAISEAFKIMTGFWTSFGVVSGFSWAEHPTPTTFDYECTEAMSEFIHNFDRGFYPKLILT